jgi:hypothetical protein
MNDLTLSILGFPAVNKDLTVELRDPLTQDVVRTVRPFLDGTTRIPKILPGAYEVTVRHPNLTLPILRRPVRVLPHGETKVSVLIDPSQFRNTPIEDIPEANLGPIRDVVASVAETLSPLAAKQPGEAILARDWNTMAASIRDLATAVGELTRVVSPTGHDHPEFVQKFDEVTGNFDKLLSTLTASLTELQRQIQAQRLREQVEDVLGQAGIDPTTGRGKEMIDLVRGLEDKVTEPPTRFGREVRNTAVQLSTKLETLIEENQNRPDFVDSTQVKQLTEAVDLAKGLRATTYDAELTHFRQVDRKLGGAVRR